MEKTITKGLLCLYNSANIWEVYRVNFENNTVDIFDHCNGECRTVSIGDCDFL